MTDDMFEQSHTLEYFFKTFECIDLIGSGCFGKIYKVISRIDGRTYSIKKVLIDSGYHNRELSTLLLIKDSPGLLNILDFLFVSIESVKTFLSKKKELSSKLESMEAEALNSVDKKYENILYIVTKCYQTNLRSAIVDGKISSEQACFIIKQICLGVFNLHQKQICHRDLKTENILVDFETNEVCVADLGSAKEFKNNNNGGIAYICSRPYRAPELILGHTKYDVNIDLWSLGCIIYEVICVSKKRLFHGKTGADILKEIVALFGPPSNEDLDGMDERRDVKIVSEIEPQNISDSIDPKYDKELAELMKECLRWNPKKRANLEEWLKSSYFSNSEKN